MKTLLYNPIFINPQAYYVFPRLTRYLQPDNESTSEPANYIGTIEVKVIAYGDTTLKRTYTNTDSIDLSEFKNTWINVSLFTKVGSCVLGEWKIGNMESDLPYIDPEVLASLKAVVIVGNKTNNDSDRAIVKNLVDASNPFVISNASYNLNSGYGKYNITFQHFPYRENIISINDNKVVFDKGGQLLLPYPSMDRDIPSFKVKVSGLSGTYHFRYYYRDSNGAQDSINMAKDGIYELPICYNVQSSSDGTNCGFANNGSDIVTIEQVPEFQGAFVTDGVNDVITSTKTVLEMLGETNEITVVSMIHQITLNSKYNIGLTNYIRSGVTGNSGPYLRSLVTDTGKTGIYGYTAYNLNKNIDKNSAVINNILGDKNDYFLDTNNDYILDDSLFSVQNFVHRDGSISDESSSIAWYWTVIANKVLTADQINQVIAYYDLDRTLSPDIYCDVAKQGITNSNHTDFDDKLIDYSGNGRDIQLNNLAWDGDSGIGKYNYPNWKVNVTQGNKYARIVYYDSINGTYSADFKGITDLYKSYGLSIEIRVNRANTVDFHSIKEDGIYTMTPPDDTTSIDIRFGGENVYNASCDITITQIPSHAGGLCLDGVNDFGKVIGMPIYKDYTFIADRQVITNDNSGGIVASKSESAGDVTKQGAFIFEYLSNNAISTWSYYKNNSLVANSDSNRNISYQSKYSYNGKAIEIGESKDSDKLWIGTIRDNDERFANISIYSLMSFPYSMSEFLIERQLKKYKLGTLYPDMVEFRPVIKSNVLLDAKPTFVIRGTSTYLNAGDYVPENSQIWVSIKMNNIADRITKFTVNGKTIDIPENAYSEVTLQYGFPFVIDKSPQKISITIEQDENYVLFNPTINSNAIFEVGNEQNMTELIAKVRNHEIDGFIMYLSKLESKYILPNSWINKDTEVISSIYCLDNILQDDLHINIDGNSKYCLYADSSNNISEFLIMDDNVFEEQYITNVLTANTIDIQLDQYIRYEDIVQPYPVLLRFNDENGNEVSWGGKFRVGSTITRIGSIDDPESNLLNGLYSINGLTLNGKNVTSSTHIVEKQMVFKTTATYLLDNNEPKVILSPRLLRIPNSSYKILGHIPDISGHGNHGVIHNSAYTEGSGVNEDGSWQFDGVDDFINIPTLSSGGKQVLMKVNWQSDYDVPGYMYDSNAGEYRNYIAKGNKEQIAYENASKTYIDGILNANLTSADLKDITHNITSQFNNASGIPYIGCRYSLENFLKMSLYDFMLLDNISTDDKIKQLNEYVGIEGNTE